jgi:MFS transporter, DHA1 family, inner membrane transport protein
VRLVRALPDILRRPSVVLFAALFASQAALLVLSPILPELARELGVSIAAAGQLRTVSGATGGLTAIVLVLLARRPGLRTLLSAGAALVTAGSALSAAAPSFTVLAGAQSVIGVGVGLLIAAGIAAAGEWSAPAERPRTLAWTIAGMPVAWVLGMPLAGVAASVDWRVAWLALPATSGLIALLLLQRVAPDRPTVRRCGAGAWRRPEVARFTAGELLAMAAWAGVLTYAGALLIESYGAARGTVSAGLGLAAAAMVPGTFVGRRGVARATPAGLAALTIAQAALLAALGVLRPAAGLSLAILTVMAFLNGWRSVMASGLGMESAPEDKLTVMSLRAAANQFGYLLGAALGGLALAAGGFAALGLRCSSSARRSISLRPSLRTPVRPRPRPEPTRRDGAQPRRSGVGGSCRASHLGNPRHPPRP